MIVILSESHRRGLNWLVHHRPKIKGHEALILTRAIDAYKVRGHKFCEPQDELYWESDPEGSATELLELLDTLHAAGFRPQWASEEIGS